MTEKSRWLSEVRGRFFRSVAADRLDSVLTPNPESAGRYHRPGQPTLYMSPFAEWSIMAISGYMREDQHPRFLVPVMVGPAMVVDQRDEQACEALGIDRSLSSKSWRDALLAGEEPPSWKNSDLARTTGADGLIDCSRMIAGGWHLNLFRWNHRGGPQVEVCGEPVEIRLSQNGAKWGL
jgi:RES domain-containing protein